MKSRFDKKALGLLMLGAVLGIAISYIGIKADGWLGGQMSPINSNSTADEPLYWVAPMDPNFKRDKPGKSPMGMDLVPVYEADQNPAVAGAITISADLQNNLSVTSAAVKKQVLKRTITTYGDVKVNEDAILHIHPRVSGWLETLFVKSKGTPITKGQVLYLLYSPELVSAQEEFLLALEQGNQNLVRAAEQRLRTLRVAEQSIASLRETRRVIRDMPFYSPVNGYVDGHVKQEGFYITPKDTIMAVASSESVWVIADVFPNDLPWIAGVRQASIKEFAGVSAKVDFIYPQIDPITRTSKVRLVIDNPPDYVKPNQFVTLVFAENTAHAKHSAPVLTVPLDAVIRTGDQDRVVLAMGEGKYKSVAVVLGRSTGSHYEIKSGLKEGDEVVTSAQFLLDSESSIYSDFKRLQTDSGSESADSHSAWTHATVNAVQDEERILNLTHGELDAFGMPAMTMNFKVVEGVDIKGLAENMEIHVEIRRGKGVGSLYEVHTIHQVKP